jgi:hypothetical protein
MDALGMVGIAPQLPPPFLSLTAHNLLYGQAEPTGGTLESRIPNPVSQTCPVAAFC